MSGWAAISTDKALSNDHVYISLKNPTGARILVEARKTYRADVALYFKQPQMLMDGFELMIDASNLHGSYEMRVVQQKGTEFFECDKMMVSITR